jgi:hypothetical protein
VKDTKITDMEADGLNNLCKANKSLGCKWKTTTKENLSKSSRNRNKGKLFSYTSKKIQSRKAEEFFRRPKENSDKEMNSTWRSMA